jgi:hypothetical protein
MWQEIYSSDCGHVLRFSDCKEKTPSRKARDAEAAKKLWDLSAKLVGLGDWNPFTADDSAPTS